ncbi:MAG: UTP--glucose-1-phosphate uridylyltransferase GalU [Campylobacteraceae bacterium]|jgi:UTP--glucose-1-phosphate uridylyltransferase|nr:UTP--glucose-1-phosphate uridylyltransferase GalU [Campylobacteraceae bacterium]
MIKKCLFPAAGYGTRFLPATKSLPKEMLPIITKPLIHYGVEEALEAGMNTMAIVTGRGKRALEDYFDISYELEHQIKGSSKEPLLKGIRHIQNSCVFTYIRQKEMRGLGDAVLKGEPLIGQEPFAVVLADDFCIHDKGDGVLKQMVKIYNKYKCSVIGIMEVPKSETYRYGIVQGDIIDDNILSITDMVEKPKVEDAPSNLAIIGRYILTPDIFKLIKSVKPGAGGEIQITDALKMQAQEGKVIGYKFEGVRFDCGSIEGFVEATNYMYNRGKECW